jgi:2-methylcitrate dehydratase PrpD
MAATLAVSMDRGCTELDVLNAFVTGFEVGATLGEQGTGPRLAGSGWHPTGVLGHFSAVCSAASLLRLSREQIANALGLAATQAGGLQASGGSMAKPFHVGKAAMNGVMAAELAAMGMDANTALLDHPVKGVLGCLFQESIAGDLEALGKQWQIEGNTFKPYAACQLTHAPYEAAFGMAREFSPIGLRQITVHVHPLAIEVAGRPRASTPMEGKFSIAYCVGLGLLGHGADISGFSERRLADPDLRRLPEITRVLPSDTVERWAARVELDYEDTGVRLGETKAVLGSPGRPLSWSDLDRKFLA